MTDTEKEALCARIDELCAENERLHAEQAHWELGNCPSCPNVVSLQEALEQNAKLRELVETMHGDMREMLDTIDKGSDTWGFCRYYGELLDSAETRMRELGIEAD